MSEEVPHLVCGSAWLPVGPADCECLWGDLLGEGLVRHPGDHDGWRDQHALLQAWWRLAVLQNAASGATLQWLPLRGYRLRLAAHFSLSR